MASSQKLAVIAIILAVALWWGWPSSLSKVTNISSRGTNVIAFGDSLTAGYGAGAGEDYPTRLAEDLGRQVVNAGVSGDTTESAAARLDADVLAFDPRIVIVGLGGNDFLQSVPIATTEANLRGIIEKVQGAGAMVVLLGFRFPSMTASYETMYERVARDTGSMFIPDLLDGILRNPSLKSDDIHPNGRGYELMAGRVAGPVKKLIQKADRSR